MSALTVILAIAGYLVFLLFVLALLTAAKRADEAAAEDFRALTDGAASRPRVPETTERRRAPAMSSARHEPRR